MQGKISEPAKNLALIRRKYQMYKKHDQLSIDDFVFPYGKLNPENDWVKLADSIPWDIIEDRYAKKFVKNGHPAYSARIALGSLLIKQRLNCSDEWVVKHITENPYLQYFIGLKEFTEKRPLAPNSMTEFRKRFSAGELAEINELIIGEKDEKHTTDLDDHDDNSNDNNDNGNNSDNNSGTLVVDATCVQQEISYPQDIKLLNDSREKLEEIIDELHAKSGETKKPRTYRRKARQDYLNISKSKRNSAKKLKKGIRKQLAYINRDIGYINDYLMSGLEMTDKRFEQFDTILSIYGQQKEMLDNNKHTVENRIVSLHQPYIRPIIRGKAKAKVEFGGKLNISVVNGYVRIEKFSFDSFNEGKDLINCIEHYRKIHGHYPKRVLADGIFRNRENLNFCKEHGIAISGKPLGRPKKDNTVDKKQEDRDICDRNIVEAKIVLGKRSYGLGLIKMKLAQTTRSAVALSVLMMNIVKAALTYLRFWLAQFGVGC